MVNKIIDRINKLYSIEFKHPYSNNLVSTLYLGDNFNLRSTSSGYTLYKYNECIGVFKRGTIEAKHIGDAIVTKRENIKLNALLEL